MIGGDGKTERMMDLDGRGSVCLSALRRRSELVIDHQWRSRGSWQPDRHLIGKAPKDFGNLSFLSSTGYSHEVTLRKYSVLTAHTIFLSQKIHSSLHQLHSCDYKCPEHQ